MSFVLSQSGCASITYFKSEGDSPSYFDTEDRNSLSFGCVNIFDYILDPPKILPISSFIGVYSNV